MTEVGPAPQQPHRTGARTLAEKVWDDHLVVKGEDGEPDLIYIDLHLVHEVTSPQAFDGLRAEGRPRAPPRPRRSRPRTTTPRRWTSTSRSPTSPAAPRSRRCAATPRSSASACTRSATPSRASCTSSARSWASRMPGITVVCGDSHTSTHGAFGAHGVRHRHQRGRARPGHPDAAAEAVQDHGDHRRGRRCARRDGQGHHPRRHRARSAPAAARATCSSTAAAPSARSPWRAA